MKTALRPSESVVKEGAANLQKGIETVGGRLYLTNERLVFEAHLFNVRGGTTELELGEVASMATSWTRFLGAIPILPNSLAAFSRSGEEFRFVLNGRGAWKEAIGRAAQMRTA